MSQKELALKRDSEKVCIICEKKEETGRTHGLCSTHIKRYRAARKLLRTDAEKQFFDDQLNERGLLLKSQKPGRPHKDHDDFRELAEQIRTGTVGPESIADVTIKRAEELMNEAEKRLDNKIESGNPPKQRRRRRGKGKDGHQ